MKPNQSIITLAACLVLAIALSGNALATNTPPNTIVLNEGPFLTDCYNSSGNLVGYGGEFTAELNNDPSTIFTTFCLQQTVDFYPGATYNYTTSENLGLPTDNPGYSYLSAGASWLYSQFVATPSNFNGSDAAVTEFQEAIWELEGENVYAAGTGDVIDPTTNADYLAAVAATVPNGLNPNSNGGNDVFVAVLTTQDASPQNAQNQLIFIPGNSENSRVPDGGASVALLGMALGGIALIRRKLRA